MAEAGVTSVIRRDDESCGKDKIFSEEFSHLSWNAVCAETNCLLNTNSRRVDKMSC